MGNSFKNPVEINIYSPIFRHVGQKRYLTSFYPAWDNSFGNSVETSTYSPNFQQVDFRKETKTNQDKTMQNKFKANNNITKKNYINSG